MKNSGRYSSLHSRKRTQCRAFTLIEVLIAAIIISTFIGSAVFLVQNVGETRVDNQALRDRNAWANVQSQLTAEGVRADSGEGSSAAVWNNSSFKEVKDKDSSFMSGRYEDEESEGNPGFQNKAVGHTTIVRPFAIQIENEAQVGARVTRRTVGFQLVDRQAALGDSGGFENKDPFTPPEALTIELAWAPSNSSASSGAKIGSSTTINAATDLDWYSGPKIYLLAKTNRDSADSPPIVSIETDGSASSPVSESQVPGWTYVRELTDREVDRLAGPEGLEVEAVAVDGDSRAIANGVLKLQKAKLTAAVMRTDSAQGSADSLPVMLGDVANEVVNNGSNPQSFQLVIGIEGADESDWKPAILSKVSITGKLGTRSVLDGVPSGTDGKNQFSVKADDFAADQATSLGYQAVCTNASRLFIDDRSAYGSCLVVPHAQELPGVKITSGGEPVMAEKPFEYSEDEVEAVLEADPEHLPILNPSIDDRLFDIRYTTDGSDPTADAALYNGKGVTIGPDELNGGDSVLLSAASFVSDPVLVPFLTPRDGFVVGAFKKAETGWGLGDLLVKKLSYMTNTSKIVGDIQVNTASDLKMDSSAHINGRLLMPGNPKMKANPYSNASYNMSDGSGSRGPANHRITMENDSRIDMVVRYTDPVKSFPEALAADSPTGPRPSDPRYNEEVLFNSWSHWDPDVWKDVRNISLQSWNDAPPLEIPEGNYGSLQLDSTRSVILGREGEDTVYSFDTIRMNGTNTISIRGHVTIKLANIPSLNNNCTFGNSEDWRALDVHIRTSGSFTIRNYDKLYMSLIAPDVSIEFTNNSYLEGSLAAGEIVNMNSGAVLKAGGN